MSADTLLFLKFNAYVENVKTLIKRTRRVSLKFLDTQKFIILVNYLKKVLNLLKEIVSSRPLNMIRNVQNYPKFLCI